MELKNNLKTVEKNKSFTVYDITLDIEQTTNKCSTRNLLKVDYRVACNSETSLSEFVLKLKSDPIEAYRNQFLSSVPISSVITIVKVDPSEYTIKNNIDSSSLFILTCHENFCSNNLIKFNRDLIGYHPNID